MRTTLERLEISVHALGFLLVESPESLGDDVAITLLKGGIAQPSLLVRESTGGRVLILPGALNPGNYRLAFDMDRVRYRALSPDGDSTFRQTASVEFTL